MKGYNSVESLSVIVPAYNCKEYLRSCISSVISVNDYCRTMFVCEIILVDDGSTDGTSELCDSLAATSESEICKIRVIHQNNRGVSAARNVGLRAVTGTFILFVDSDDTIDSRTLGELMQMIAQDKSVDMAVFGLSFDYYVNKRIFRRDLMSPPVEGSKSLSECTAILYNLFMSNMISSLCNKLIRKDVIDYADVFLQEDLILYEDLEFSLQTMSRCSTIYFCSEPIYHYRQTPDEGNAGRRLKRITHIPEIVDKVEDALIPFGDQTDILMALYLALAREKTIYASRNEVEVVCNDFREWIDQHGFKKQIERKKYAKLLYNRNITCLIFQRNKSRIRHRLANWIKQNIGDFRKWKFRS